MIVERGVCGQCDKPVVKITVCEKEVHYVIRTKWVHAERGPQDHRIPLVFFPDNRTLLVGERVRFYGGTVDYRVIGTHIIRRKWTLKPGWMVSQRVDLVQVDGRKKGQHRWDVPSGSVNVVTGAIPAQV